MLNSFTFPFLIIIFSKSKTTRLQDTLTGGSLQYRQQSVTEAEIAVDLCSGRYIVLIPAGISTNGSSRRILLHGIIT